MLRKNNSERELRMRSVLCACIAILAVGFVVRAYYPIQCNSEHAASDFADAEAIVIARCIKVERKMEQIPNQKYQSFYYMATLKVGRAIKGELKTGDEFEMCEGGYIAQQEDNVTPTYVAQCNTHPGAGLEPNGVFLMYLKTRDLKTWYPVSCHFSIHEMVDCLDEKTNKHSLGVKESVSMRSRSEQTVPLDEFLKRKENEAAEAAKNRAEEKPASPK